MSDNKTESPILDANFYKKEANRFKRIFELQRMKIEEVPAKAHVSPYLCLGCMWLSSCNSVRMGGCEEYEQKMNYQM